MNGSGMHDIKRLEVEKGSWKDKEDLQDIDKLVKLLSNLLQNPLSTRDNNGEECFVFV